MPEVVDEALADLIAPGNVVIIGELHGTNEFPRLAGRLATLAIDQGLPVLVGLEIPASEQAAINDFLAGDGHSAHIDRLTASSFWRRPAQHDDGRSGRAVVEMLALLRAGGARGHLEVCAFDRPWMTEGAPVTPDLARALSQHRDQLMAENLVPAMTRQIGTRSRTFTVILAGSIHTRVTRRPGFPEPHLGELLLAQFPSLTALEGQWTGGRFRAMTSASGAEVHEASACLTTAGSIGRYASAEEVQRSGHHGWVNVGALTPSLPAY